jgi:hypothetical protein
LRSPEGYPVHNAGRNPEEKAPNHTGASAGFETRITYAPDKENLRWEKGKHGRHGTVLFFRKRFL